MIQSTSKANFDPFFKFPDFFSLSFLSFRALPLRTVRESSLHRRTSEKIKRTRTFARDNAQEVFLCKLKDNAQEVFLCKLNAGIVKDIYLHRHRVSCVI